MSAPTTPKSSVSSTTTQSPAYRDSDILTPSRKVRALLAQFDDDSESASEAPSRNKYPSKAGAALSTAYPAPQQQISEDSSTSSEDEDVLVKPRGRLAARMQGNLEASADGNAVQQETRVSSRDTSERVPANSRTLQNGSSQDCSSGEDELAAPLRRLHQRKSSPIAESTATEQRSRSHSPFFVPSPTAHESRKLVDSDETENAGPTVGDEAETSQNTNSKSKFMALVEKHRKQRLEKEAEDEKKRAARIEQLKAAGLASGRIRGSSPADSSAEDSELEAGLAQNQGRRSRPARGASKKAIDEMKREQERIKRNMQLAHQAKTRKKITKESLLARFNFQPPGEQPSGKVLGTNLASSSSAPASDVESKQGRDTPPTSPLTANHLDDQSANKVESMTVIDPPQDEEATNNNVDLQDAQKILAQPAIDKGKGKAAAIAPEEESPQRSSDLPKTALKPRPASFLISKQNAMRNNNADDDLEILTSPPPSRSKLSIFNKLPAKKAHEAPSHHLLRVLAHLTNQEQLDRNRKFMTSAEMETSLRRMARLQAAQERIARVEELKAIGKAVHTSEEVYEQKQQDLLDESIEKARQEGVEIARREREWAKKNGGVIKDGLDDSDDEEDEDFEDEDLDDEQISGSEEEPDADGEDSDEEEYGRQEDDEETAVYKDKGTVGKGGLIDNEAEEGAFDDQAEEESAEAESEPNNNATVKATPINASRRGRKSRVLNDDEDEEDEETITTETPTLPQNPISASKTPQSGLRSARKEIPGLQNSDDLPLGLTQAFAATMADSQPDSPTRLNSVHQPESQEQDSLSILQSIPSPAVPVIPFLNRRQSTDLVQESLPATQIETQPLNLDLNFTQNDRFRRGSHILESPMTQFSEIPDPTQDAGYVMTPWKERRFDTETPQQLPQSTIDTVILPPTDSPLVQRKGRLQRGSRRGDELDKNEVSAEHSDQHHMIPSAFDDMRRSSARLYAKQPALDHEKERAKAQEMIEEAAEESEDDWQGMGGLDGEDHASENEEDRGFRNDDEDEDVDESLHRKEHMEYKLAKDKKDVHDMMGVTTGAARRKRRAANDLDLSDEEDAYRRRKEIKRREHARMMRELLKSDERVEKIAEDPRKAAFLKAIEDRESDDDDEGPELSAESQNHGHGEDRFLGQVEDENQEKNDQPEKEEQNRIAVTTPSFLALNPSKPSTTNRLPGPMRRTAAKPSLASREAHLSRKPTTQEELRESLSFLIEEPDSQQRDHFSDDEELEINFADIPNESDQENMGAEDSNEDEEMSDSIVENSQPDTYPNAHPEINDSTTSETSIAAPNNPRDAEQPIFKKPTVPRSLSLSTTSSKPPHSSSTSSLNPRAPAASRRTPLPNQRHRRGEVVNRLALLRHSSSSSSSSTASLADGMSSSSRMAFMTGANAGASASATGFKVPALLRKATSNLSVASSASSSAAAVVESGTERGSVGEERAVVRKRGVGMGAGAGVKSAVNWREKGRGGVRKLVGGGGEARKGSGKRGGKEKGKGSGSGGFLKGLFGASGGLGAWE
ncbi:MAG: hypothetical protein Q9227_001340 [Pyrenula ochraceoflavens]